uniref:Secreted protein n=1 Tax=Globodera pallida TaxID=36090 RepID=A0A183C6K9_GLOPA
MRAILFFAVVCLVLAALLETANSKPADKKAKKGAPAKGKASLKAAIHAIGKAAKAERDANNFGIDNIDAIEADPTEFDGDNDFSGEQQPLDDDASAGGSSGDYSGIELDQDSQYPD